MKKSLSHKKRFKHTSIITLSSLLLFSIPTYHNHSFENTHNVEAATAENGPFKNPVLEETKQLQDGVNYSKMIFGKQDPKDHYTIDISFFTTKEKAKEVKDDLKSDGYEPYIQTIKERAQDDPNHKPLGYLVRVGSYTNEQQAKETQSDLLAKGYLKTKVVFTGEDGQKTSGPWVVHVLKINPKKFSGHLSPVLGNDHIPGKEKPSEMAKRMDALAGINGGYFVMGSKDGTEGDLAGISLVNGNLTSEAVNGRASLILNPDNSASISSLSTKLAIQTKDGNKKEMDGINRVPGLIRGCGGIGDLETDKPKHDVTCTDSSEIIQYTNDYGTSTPQGEGMEAVIDNQTGKVTEFRNRRGGPLPQNQTVIAATNEDAEWLKEHIHVGERVEITDKILKDNHPLNKTKGMGIINGGPRLLNNGMIDIPATAEGFHQPDHPEFYYQFGLKRHPRTIAGIKRDGTILLVTIDGRKPGYSVGMNFKESAELLKSLGAVEGINLDGGGSTSMNVNKELVTHPSDSTGERPVGDAILLLPN